MSPELAPAVGEIVINEELVETATIVPAAIPGPDTARPIVLRDFGSARV